MSAFPAVTPDVPRITANVFLVVPQVPPIMPRLGDIALPQIMADLSAVPPYVADILATITPVSAEVSPVAAELVPLTAGGLGGRQSGGSNDQ